MIVFGVRALKGDESLAINDTDESIAVLAKGWRWWNEKIAKTIELDF